MTSVFAPKAISQSVEAGSDADNWPLAEAMTALGQRTNGPKVDAGCHWFCRESLGPREVP